VRLVVTLVALLYEALQELAHVVLHVPQRPIRCDSRCFPRG
jgi:hypothetical protein